MRKFFQALKAIFKIATLISSDDTQAIQQGIFRYMGSNPKGQLFTPYGTFGRAPDGSMVAVFSQNGNESNAIGMASDPNNRTLKGLKQGEYGIGNYTSGSYIFFPENGDMIGEVKNDAVFTCADTFKILIGATVFEFSETGLTVDGTAVDVIADGISLVNHTHSQGSDSDGDSEVETDAPS